MRSRRLYDVSTTQLNMTLSYIETGTEIETDRYITMSFIVAPFLTVMKYKIRSIVILQSFVFKFNNHKIS